jgi:hypothetical protein
MKHGLLAREVPNIFMEDTDDFDSLLKSLFEEWRPEGTTEELCVQMIASYMWRLKRAYRAENGQLTQQKDEVDSELFLKKLRTTEDLRKVTFIKETGSERVRKHEELDHMSLTSSGVRSLQDTLLRVSATVEKTGTLPKELKDEMITRFGTDFGFPEKSPNNGHSIDSSELQRFTEALDTELSRLETLCLRLYRIEEVDRPALLQQASVPCSMVQKRILCYEAHILRQLYRAMDELEHLQQRRIERSGAPVLEMTPQRSPRIAGLGRKPLALRSRNI